MTQQPFHASLLVGPSPSRSRIVLLLVHGRGGSAESMRSVHSSLGHEDVGGVIPQAPGGTWYPRSFLSPIDSNQPFLGRSLLHLDTLVTGLAAEGISSSKIALLGFSQGACLALEYAARHPRRYAAVMGLSGGLIGPPGSLREYPGDLEGTPVFLGASDPDPHVPFARVQETEAIFSRMGAKTEARRYPGMPHTIHLDEIIRCRELLQNTPSVSDGHP